MNPQDPNQPQQPPAQPAPTQPASPAPPPTTVTPPVAPPAVTSPSGGSGVKIALIVAGTIVVLAILGFGGYLLTAKKTNGNSGSNASNSSTSTNTPANPPKNSAYDTTPTTSNTVKNDCFRYDIPMPHDAIPEPQKCTDDNIYGNDGLGDNYHVDTVGYLPDGVNDLASCTSYVTNFIKSDATITSTTDITLGGQPGKLIAATLSGGAKIDYVVGYSPRVETDSQDSNFQYRCFEADIEVFDTYSQGLANTLISTWIWR